MQREWVVRDAAQVSDELRQVVGGHPLVARLLAQRGITDASAARAFLDPAYYVPTRPEEMPGIVSAVAVVRQALSAGSRIRVWGDFDADGETATAVLVEALASCGAQVDYRLPGRQDGHGLSRSALAAAGDDGIGLMITCDTGIEAAEPVREAVEAGLSVIITDHHDLPKVLPPAHAVVNPKLLPDSHAARELTGVGVAYVLASALLSERPEGGEALESLLDIVAIGLVGDVATQTGDVRYLVQCGLRVLRAGARTGLRAMLTLAGIDARYADEGTIGYQIAPRLNAAGRLDDASLAVRLLLTHDPDEADTIARRLEAINLDRQARTDALYAQVVERLQANGDIIRRPAILVDGEGWEAGVLGLVAGRLAHEYDRPAILIAHSPGRASTASARSVAGIDVHAAIASQRDLLVREGGHPMAAGFAIARQDIRAFSAGLMEHIAAQSAACRPVSELIVDAEIPWGEVGLDLARELARLAPYGPGNPEPVLAARAGTLVRFEDVSRKRETDHRRMFVNSDLGESVRITWFNAKTLPQTGESIDVALHVGVRWQRGEERLDLTLVDWRPAAERLRVEVADLVAGREIVDWRTRSDRDALLAELQSRHGTHHAVWAEGLDVASEDWVSRVDLRAREVSALAILTPPPEPAVLGQALRDTAARLVYLLPPLTPADVSPARFVWRVAGMVRVSLSAHGGYLDTGRMAARLGARQSAVIAALQGLQAAGKINLERDGSGLVARAPTDSVAGGCNRKVEAAAMDPEQRVAVESARAALAFLLAETAAYRRFYVSAALADLFGASHP